MENMKLYSLLFELKGMIKTLSELANYDENYQIPMIETIEEKMKEITQEIEKIHV
jgi:hypothetical protein